MFVASFKKTKPSSEAGKGFRPNKNGIMPFLGLIIAGIATGSVIDGTIFQSEGLEENQLYACKNSVDPDFPNNVQTTVLFKADGKDVPNYIKELGEGQLIQNKEEVTITNEAPATGAPKSASKANAAEPEIV